MQIEETTQDTPGPRANLAALLRSEGMQRFYKFATVGAFTWTVDFGTLNLMQRTLLIPREPNLELKVFAATAIAFFVGIAVNFTLNRYWTFQAGGSGALGRQMFR